MTPKSKLLLFAVGSSFNIFESCNPLSKAFFLSITSIRFWCSPFCVNERLDTCEFIKPLVVAWRFSFSTSVFFDELWLLKKMLVFCNQFFHSLAVFFDEIWLLKQMLLSCNQFSHSHAGMLAGSFSTSVTIVTSQVLDSYITKTNLNVIRN
jgi:hypothetical protein